MGTRPLRQFYETNRVFAADGLDAEQWQQRAESPFGHVPAAMIFTTASGTAGAAAASPAR